MCTVVIAAGVVPGAPLVVVANRDERLGRPATPPFRWPEGFVAPRDELAGGTWLGVNAHGVFVGITNRYLGPQEDRVSRGAIVTAALALPSARAIHDAMRDVPPSRHNGLHLVYADADAGDVLATVSDGASLAQLTFGRGLHVVTERSFAAGGARLDGPRLARIAAAWARVPKDPDGVKTLLTEHDPNDPFGSTCIHIEGIDYGTRSGAVVWLASQKTARRMLWAEGPPCKTPFTDVALP